MKVIRKGSVKFEEILLGELFMIEYNIFMKIVKTGQCNAVEIATGCTYTFVDVQVYRIKGSFVEE